MHVRVFTLKFSFVTEQFDDEELQEFIKDKELLSVREHFFLKHETPYLAVFLTYKLGLRELKKSGKGKTASWQKSLSDEELPLFNTLRGWRSERAKQEGIPPYIIGTDAQLVQIVKERPASLTALGKIRGVGKAKLEAYGEDILAIVASNPPKDKQASQEQQKEVFKAEHDT